MVDHWGYEIVTCPGCGIRVIPGQRYCSVCGERIGVTDMESYLRGIQKAMGHTCEECRYYRDYHCSNPSWRGSKNKELIYGDRKYVEPKSDACVLYDGEEEFDDA